MRKEVDKLWLAETERLALVEADALADVLALTEALVEADALADILAETDALVEADALAEVLALTDALAEALVDCL